MCHCPALPSQSCDSRNSKTVQEEVQNQEPATPAPGEVGRSHYAPAPNLKILHRSASIPSTDPPGLGKHTSLFALRSKQGLGSLRIMFNICWETNNDACKVGMGSTRWNGSCGSTIMFPLLAELWSLFLFLLLLLLLLLLLITAVLKFFYHMIVMSCCHCECLLLLRFSFFSCWCHCYHLILLLFAVVVTFAD